MEKVPDVIWDKLLADFTPSFLTEGMMVEIDQDGVFQITDGRWRAMLFNEARRLEGKVRIRVYCTNFVPFTKEQLQSEALVFLKRHGFE